jgi:hypothetical protein
MNGKNCRAAVPKNIKGAKTVDGIKLLITSAYVFWRGTVWNILGRF